MLCFAAVVPLAMTAACGQKGPLYLPPRNGTVVTRPAGPGPAPAPAPAPESTTPSSTPPQTTNQSTPDTTTSPSTPGRSGNKKDDSQTTPPK
jgi:predicted small lipoprotein YifL